MVPEIQFTLPVVTGALIAGPLIIGAAILALIGVGAVYLSGGRKQTRRLTQPQPFQGLGQGEPDPLDQASSEDLRLQAGEMLVAADNAVQSSEQELLFASAAYGDEQVAPFQKDLDEAKEHLRESFRLQQQVDAATRDHDHGGDEAQARSLHQQIIRNCERVNETLQSHKDQFDQLRNLEQDPRPALDQLAEQLQQLRARRQQADSALTGLAQHYHDGALSQYRDNLAQSGQVLESAQQSHSAAAAAVERSSSAEAVVALHSGEQAAADAGRLIESMEEAEERLGSARKNLDVGIAQTEQDLAQARATHQAGQAPELAGPIAAAETAVKRAKEALASGDRIDPLELLQQLELAHRELDAPLNSVRDRQAKDRRAREMLEHELLTARNQVQSSLDFLRSRRYGVSSTARTRMAEAERCLTEAQTTGDSQPSRAVELAQQAKTLAIQAAQIAEREAATAGMQSMGGGFGGYGTGGGFGGFGYGGGGYGTGRVSWGGPGHGGFGYRPPRRRRGFF
ncbi:TPM domain-containing protein [Nesterenkonia muleiensis]|uniref:TPM domain-containing protein n=1 Tax=Nesterenkonia muleiensis TaxID=2282648 RepID=UPI0013903C3A|nr:TPM domain-containing protein [Nesterenkonia muleiensis]